MPICRKCENKFPNSVKINNIKKNLQRRRYCLLCSPFGSYLGKRIDIDICCSNRPKERICEVCSRQYVYEKNKGHTLKECNTCRSRKRSQNIKQKAVNYKGGCCQKCGYNKYIGSLVFHHLDPTQKDFQISTNHCRKWETVRIELDKCLLVCHNCHNEIHAGIL